MNLINKDTLISKLKHQMTLCTRQTTEQVYNSIILDVCCSSDDIAFKSTEDLKKGIESKYNIPANIVEIDKSIDFLSSDGQIYFDNKAQTYVASPEAKSNYSSKIDDTTFLWNEVQKEFFEEISKFNPDIVPKDYPQIWDCLLVYISKVFDRFGAETIQLISSKHLAEPSTIESIDTFIQESIDEKVQNVQLEVIKAIIKKFFLINTSNRQRFLKILLDTTYSALSISSDKMVSTFLSQSFSQTKILLDTNFILCIIGLSDHILVDVSKELLSTINENNLPFSLYYHKETLNEIIRTLTQWKQKLPLSASRPNLSKAALGRNDLNALEKKYHEKNCESQNGISVEAFLVNYENIREILHSMNIKIFQPHISLLDEYKTNIESSISEYSDILTEHRWKEKSPNTLRHDIVLWYTIKALRNYPSTIFDAKALILTNDFTLNTFDRRESKKDDSLPNVVLSSQMMQIIRPFIKPNEGFDRQLLKLFAMPEFRSLDVDYKGITSIIVNYINSPIELDEDVYARILGDKFLRRKIEEANENQEVIKKSIDEVFMKVNEEQSTKIAELLRDREKSNKEMQELKVKMNKLNENFIQMNEYLEKSQINISAQNLEIENDKSRVEKHMNIIKKQKVFIAILLSIFEILLIFFSPKLFGFNFNLSGISLLIIQILFSILSVFLTWLCILKTTVWQAIWPSLMAGAWTYLLYLLKS